MKKKKKSTTKTKIEVVKDENDYENILLWGEVGFRRACEL